MSSQKILNLGKISFEKARHGLDFESWKDNFMISYAGQYQQNIYISQSNLANFTYNYISFNNENKLFFVILG